LVLINISSRINDLLIFGQSVFLALISGMMGSSALSVFAERLG